MDREQPQTPGTSAECGEDFCYRFINGSMIPANLAPISEVIYTLIPVCQKAILLLLQHVDELLLILGKNWVITRIYYLSRRTVW
jgi:hypothetical protein